MAVPNGGSAHAEGAVWAQTAGTFAHTGRPAAPKGWGRVREVAGPGRDRLGLLGGPEHMTLLLLAAEWRGIKHVNEAVADRHRPARPPTPDHRPFAEKC
jgi:hypothetical protein